MSRSILILFALLSIAFAQTHKPQPLPKLQTQYPVYLLQYPSVSKELGISSSVRQKVTKIRSDADRRRLAMMAPTTAHPNQPRFSAQEYIAEAKRTDDAILALLSSKQKARLAEIGLQYAGAFGLLDTRVGRELNMTTQQQLRLQDAATKRERAFAQVMRSITGGSAHLVGSDPKAQTKKLMDARIAMIKNLNGDAVNILTPVQRTKWSHMQGKPFPVESLYAPHPANSMNVKSGSRQPSPKRH
jgi:hypothetical protein